MLLRQLSLYHRGEGFARFFTHRGTAFANLPAKTGIDIGEIRGVYRGRSVSAQ